MGTVTEIYDYLRLLFARIGIPHCPNCGKAITQQTTQQIVDNLMAYPERTRMQILAPVIRGKKGEHRKILEDLRKSGYVRLRIDGEIKEVSEEINLEKNKKHTIEVVVDRIIIREGIEGRLADSIDTALTLGEGIVLVDLLEGEELIFSEKFACVDCGISFEELSPRMFSFNSPYGACPQCEGLGHRMEIDLDLIIPDDSLSLAQGAIKPWSKNLNNIYNQSMECVAKHYNFDLNIPVKDLDPKYLNIILYGSGEEKIKFQYTNRFGDVRVYETSFEGAIPSLQRRYMEALSEGAKSDIEQYMTTKPCPECQGARLKPHVLAVKISGKNINDITNMSIREGAEFFNTLELTERETLIARQVLKEIKERLGFLINVGLDYLNLSRAAGTLSGGEAQRIRLATQIGSSLMGVLYILDEPSIGLHQRDNDRLIQTLKHLRDIGNTLIVVEHDEDTMLASDHIIDIGPGAGVAGGQIIAQGDVEAIKNNPNSITGQYLVGAKKIPIPKIRRKPNGKWIKIKGARENNLKNINVDIPLGVFTCVTGVSGSGKSTLVNEILHKGLVQNLYKQAKVKAGKHEEIQGIEYLDKVIDIDQSPIGRTPRSNPATYTSVFDDIRALYSQTPEARMRGYQPGRFSFNVKGGRCEACRGDGIIKIEMHFLPDVYVPCEVCKGARYNRETLEIRYKGKSIAQVLDMTVDEAAEFFQNIPKIYRKLKTLQDVGLGYIRMGQPATTLSGGEAQRIKLATELSRRSNGKTLYILDEPTTGLHIADIDKLLGVLNRLVEAGDSVLVIEHNLDVIKTADYVIDLGPEGGDQGGMVVAKGTPEEIVAVEASYTGQYLKRVLER